MNGLDQLYQTAKEMAMKRELWYVGMFMLPTILCIDEVEEEEVTEVYPTLSGTLRGDRRYGILYSLN